MTKNQIITSIARQVLDLETLDTRLSDSLDFSEQAVWNIREALELAYQAGINEKEREIQALIAESEGEPT
jgi:hypothetical protein